MDIKVADVMTTDIVACRMGDSLEEVARQMLDKNISSTVVKIDIDIIGIITERDFLKAHMIENAMTAGDIMNRDLVSIEKEESALDASKVMGEHHIRHLLVMDKGQIIGIVSLRDILRVFPESIHGYVANILVH